MESSDPPSYLPRPVRSGPRIEKPNGPTGLLHRDMRVRADEPRTDAAPGLAINADPGVDTCRSRAVSVIGGAAGDRVIGHLAVVLPPPGVNGIGLGPNHAPLVMRLRAEALPG